MSFRSMFDSFYSAVKSKLEELFGKASVEQAVSATLTLVNPVVAELANLVSPGAGPLVSAALAQFQTDYATLCTVVQETFPASGATSARSVVQSLIGSLQANLQTILADAGVKNSASYGRLSGLAGFFLQEAKAILSEFAVAPAPVLPQPAPPAPALVPDAALAVAGPVASENVPAPAQASPGVGNAVSAMR